MSLKQCEQCGRAFQADQEWKRKCLDCWREGRRKREQAGRFSAVRTCASCSGTFTADEEWKRECYNCWKKRAWWESERGKELRWLRDEYKRLARGGGAGGDRVPAWIADNISWLIQKLHPDKHGGSDVAVRVTQELLKAKGNQ